MLTRKDRTLDEYKRAGADMRLMKQLGTKLVMDASKILSASDTDKLMKALDKIEVICSRAEDNMFHDFPEVSNDYLSVFYGNIDEEPRNDLDAEIIRMAKEEADALFK